MENTYKNQSRWNDVYGKSNLPVIQENPGRFIVDPSKLARDRSDLVEAMSDIRGKRVLEFGSGRGEFAVALAKLGAIVTGIDVGADLVELSKRVAAVNGVDCEFIVGGVDRLQFEDGAFDFVVGVDVLHHLSEEGVVDSLDEAHRVLEPGGMALFIEPVENSRIFDFIQNIFPVGKPGSSQYRPSILQREKWKEYLRNADDRILTDNELSAAKGRFGEIEFRYYGLFVRLLRFFPYPKALRLLNAVDLFLTRRYSPVKRLSQKALVIYRKRINEGEAR